MTTSRKDKDGSSPAEPLKRRGDNVGQSGRWGREEGGIRRYGNEERWHGSEQAGGRRVEHNDEADSERTSGTPRKGGYEGRFSPPGEKEVKSDDRSRGKNSSYGDAGGTTGEQSPIAPGEHRWQNERAEGQDKEYGRGHDADDEDA